MILLKHFQDKIHQDNSFQIAFMEKLVALADAGISARVVCAAW